MAGTEMVNPARVDEFIEPLKGAIPGTSELQTDILRLDKIHPTISGNKWLKLAYWIDTFDKGGFSGIVTLGGPWSNHLHATAYACFLKKIPLIVLIKGKAGLSNPMVQDLHQWNADIRFLDRQEFYDKQKHIALADKMKFLLIPMGGEGPEGETGVTEWFNAFRHREYDHVFCAVGTGTTLVGIAKSHLNFKNLVGVRVGIQDVSMEKKIAQLNDLLPIKNIYLTPNEGKFGRMTPELERSLVTWYLRTGIPLDFVYTGPMCQTFVKMGASGQLPSGSRVLLVHTGGLQGNRSHQGLPQ